MAETVGDLLTRHVDVILVLILDVMKEAVPTTKKEVALRVLGQLAAHVTAPLHKVCEYLANHPFLSLSLTS